MVMVYLSPPLERLHGYNLGKMGAELRSDRLHYRLQSGYMTSYIIGTVKTLTGLKR
jgi:hypothetical protein